MFFFLLLWNSKMFTWLILHFELESFRWRLGRPPSTWKGSRLYPALCIHKLSWTISVDQQSRKSDDGKKKIHQLIILYRRGILKNQLHSTITYLICNVRIYECIRPCVHALDKWRCVCVVHSFFSLFTFFPSSSWNKLCLLIIWWSWVCVCVC